MKCICRLQPLNQHILNLFTNFSCIAVLVQSKCGLENIAHYLKASEGRKYKLRVRQSRQNYHSLNENINLKVWQDPIGRVWNREDPRQQWVRASYRRITKDVQGWTDVHHFTFGTWFDNFRILTLTKKNHNNCAIFRESKRIKLLSFKGSCWLQNTNRSATMETMPGKVKVQFSPTIVDNSKVHLICYYLATNCNTKI